MPSQRMIRPAGRVHMAGASARDTPCAGVSLAPANTPGCPSASAMCSKTFDGAQSVPHPTWKP